MNKFSNLLKVTCAGLATSLSPASIALASDIVWQGDVYTKSLDCLSASHKDNTLIIRGTVNLTNPDDLDKNENPLRIEVRCDNLRFEPGAVLKTISSLNLRIFSEASGNIVIQSVRGEDGEDGKTPVELVAPRTAKKGDDRGKAPDGSDGADCHKLGGGSDRGSDGARGEDGDNGQKGAKGANGKPGTSGADVRLIVGSFAPDSTITITTLGGRGGAGDLGGRGENGGRGGHGGEGGKGGAGNTCHDPSRGGRGGDGGNGGNGGDGGPGGDGGDGGDGGNVTVGLLNGDAPPEEPMIDNRGGRGGRPGSGGDPGARGEGGNFGPGGQGGNGDIFHEGGDNGMAGLQGRPGLPGNVGPDGLPGRDGHKGRVGNGKWGIISEDSFNANF